MNESHAGAMTMCYLGVIIYMSVSLTGCRTEEVRVMVKSRSTMAWFCFPDIPVNRQPKVPEADAILN